MLAAGTVLTDRYEILERRGSGGYGTVYRARDRTRDRIVAIKVLREEIASDPDYVRRFRREADIARMLDSRHVIRILEIGRDRIGEQDIHFQVMEFVDGLTLHELLVRRSKLPPEEAVSIAIQVARALEQAETQGVVHRDVKPKNIFMGDDELVRLGDFGIARAVDFPTLRADDPIIGTPRYMSPEQCLGHGEIDIRSDIYALGIVLYEMLAGRPPFEAEGPTAIAYKQVHDTPWPLQQLAPSVPRRIADVVELCLKKNPQERFQNARQLRLALEGALRNEPVAADHTIAMTQRYAILDDATVVTPSGGVRVPPRQTSGPPPRRPSALTLLGFGGFFTTAIGVGVAAVILLGGGGGDHTNKPTSSPIVLNTNDTMTPRPTTPKQTTTPTATLAACLSSSGGPSPCIEASGLSMPDTFTPGQPFEITVIAKNQGSPGMARSVSVSFPDVPFENLNVIGEGSVKRPRVDTVSKCSYNGTDQNICTPTGTPTSDFPYPLAEVYINSAWPTSEQLRLTIQVTPPTGGTQIRVLIRATGRSTDGSVVNYPGQSSTFDQQGFKVLERVIRAR